MPRRRSAEHQVLVLAEGQRLWEELHAEVLDCRDVWVCRKVATCPLRGRLPSPRVHCALPTKRSIRASNNRPPSNLLWACKGAMVHGPTWARAGPRCLDPQRRLRRQWRATVPRPSSRLWLLLLLRRPVVLAGAGPSGSRLRGAGVLGLQAAAKGPGMAVPLEMAADPRKACLGSAAAVWWGRMARHPRHWPYRVPVPDTVAGL